MRINYNESAILANSCLNRSDKALSSAIERLSSGLKINHAKDNPAGLAISNRMDSQIRGLSQASDNTNDGISVVQSADGALSEISSILQRMNELSVQASNGTTTDEDRQLIDAEIQQLKKEITRISKDTQFNGQTLLDGTFDLKGYSSTKDISVDYYSEEVKAGKYTIDFAGLIDANGDVDVTKFKSMEGFKNLHNITAEAVEATADEPGSITIKADGNFEMKVKYDYGATSAELDITGIGAMKIQTGANENQELGIVIREISLDKMGLSKTNTKTEEDSQKSIESVKKALDYINDARAKLGAYENRMEHNESSLAITSENMTISYSRIMDVDMAEEMTEYTTQQVLTQAGISMLSQANERPEQVLQLLQ